MYENEVDSVFRALYGIPKGKNLLVNGTDGDISLFPFRPKGNPTLSEIQEQSSATASADLQLLHSTSVTPDQIDLLGHMNVRYYGVHAMAGAHKLSRQIGLTTAAEAHFTDLYTRHYLEQLEGAPLEVWGGILDIADTEVRMYLELRNPVREELGATFVFTAQPPTSESQTESVLSHAVVTAAQNALIEWPEHGKPRSIQLGSSPHIISYDEIRKLNLVEREVQVIDGARCDKSGVYQVGLFQDLVWGGENITDEDNDWLSTLENGDRMGWATMESRCTLIELPQAGARVQSFWTTVEMTRKAQQDRFWVYDIDRGVLLCTASFAEVAFNINTRRAIEIPDKERARLGEHFHPELA